jgi:hypothetical protein
VNADLLAQIGHNNQGYQVRSLLELRHDSVSNEFQILVSWLGFESGDDSWEPLLQLYEDVPDLVKDFVGSYPDHSLAERARACLG